jgi:hypothetical protein
MWGGARIPPSAQDPSGLPCKRRTLPCATCTQDAGPLRDAGRQIRIGMMT